MIANWPWTLLGIMPTNHALMATESAAAGPISKALMVQEGRASCRPHGAGLWSVGSHFYARASQADHFHENRLT
jgi:hypothetical protein